MDREYTIHDHNGLKFVNVSGNTIITPCGKEYEAEDFQLKARVVMIYGNEPDNVPPEVLYKAKFAEVLHIPEPSDQQWVDSLEEGVLVIAKPKYAIHTSTQSVRLRPKYNLTVYATTIQT